MPVVSLERLGQCREPAEAVPARAGDGLRGGHGRPPEHGEAPIGVQHSSPFKVLPAELASEPERLERFRREAKALAALDHPGIVGVYSVEEADGILFLTMQLVGGQSLDRLIPKGGMPLDQLLAIAAALAEALAAAHEKGVVHRDLKPATSWSWATDA